VMSRYIVICRPKIIVSVVNKTLTNQSSSSIGDKENTTKAFVVCDHTSRLIGSIVMMVFLQGIEKFKPHPFQIISQVAWQACLSSREWS